jgi:hypothetical protein
MAVISRITITTKTIIITTAIRNAQLQVTVTKAITGIMATTTSNHHKIGAVVGKAGITSRMGITKVGRSLQQLTVIPITKDGEGISPITKTNAQTGVGGRVAITNPNTKIGNSIVPMVLGNLIPHGKASKAIININVVVGRVNITSSINLVKANNPDIKALA